MPEQTIQAGVVIKAQVDGKEKIEALSQSIQKSSTETAQLSEEAKKLKELASAKATLGLDVDKTAHQEIEKLNAAYLTLKNSGTLSHAQLARAADLHRDKVYQLERQLGDLRPSLVDVADEVQSVVTKAGGLAYAANEAIKFERAMAAVKKVTDGTPEQYAALSGSIKELGVQLGIMPEQLAQIAAQGGQMGVAMEKLPEFVEMAAQMSVAFDINAQSAGEMAAKISNVFELNIDELRDLNDVVNTLGNTTAAREAEISEVLMRIGGNSKQFGLAANEAAALAAALISLGKSPEVAGTAINALLTKLQNAKLGTHDFKRALSDLGYSADDMAAQIAAHPQRALSDFLSKLNELDNQTRSEKLGQLFGTEYADDIALLSGSLDTYKKALETATDSERTFGAMKKETENALNTTAKRVEQAKVSISNAAIDLGNALLPAINASAHAVGSVASSLAEIGEQFPVLTQLAVLFVAAKTALNAYDTAMRLSGQSSQASLLNTNVSVEKVKLSLLETAQAAKLFGANMSAALKGDIAGIDVKTNEISKLGNSMKSLATNAMALFSAFEIGQGIGQGLYESSELVRDFGDHLGRIVAYADAILTDRTFADVEAHYRTSKELQQEAANADRIAAQERAKRDEQERLAAQKQLAQIQALQEKRHELTEKIQQNERSLTVLNQAQQSGGTTATMLAKSNDVLRGELDAVNASLDKLNVNISDVSPLAKNREALERLGLSVEQVTTGISKNAQQALDDFSLAATQYGTNAKSMATVFNQALKQMDSDEALLALKTRLNDVGKEAGLTAQEIANIAAVAPETADKVAAAFSKIGVDSQAVMSGISQGAQTAMNDFQAAMSVAKEQGIKDTRLLAAGFERMMSTLKSTDEFAAFKQQLKESGAIASLTQEQLERLNIAAEKGAYAARDAYAAARDAIEKAGDTADLQTAATQVESMMRNGQISAEQYAQSLAQLANKKEQLQSATQKSNEQTQEYCKTQEKAQKQTEQFAQASAKSSQAQKDNTAAIERGSQAMREQGESLDALDMAMLAYLRRSRNAKDEISQLHVEMGAAETATGALADKLRVLHRIRLEKAKSQRDLNQSLQTGIDLAQNLARVESIAAAHADKLDQVTLNNLHDAIDKARQKMQALADEAQNTRQAAEKELLSLQGDTEKIAKLEQQQKIQALNEKLKQAKQQGNTQAMNDYTAAINATHQAYQLKREKEQQQKREQEQKAREAAQKERLEQEKREAKTEIKLPQTPKIDVGNLDLSSITDALSEREQSLVEQVKNSIIAELKRSIKNQT